MRFEYLFVLLLGHLCHHHVICDDEALRECANIHHISIQVIPNVHATFSNHKCLLTCLVENKTLASDPLNEGVACPLDSNGICRNGQCIGGHEEAIGECGKLHSLDFHLVRNSGTQYTNSLCQLKCVIDGNVIGSHGVNEGLQCPKDFNGVCRNGQCVTVSETKPTNVPSTVPPTAPPPAPTTAPPTAPQTAPPIAPIEVSLIDANTTDPLTFQVQLCFQFTASKPFSWNSCDLSWTSEVIHTRNVKEEKCFTIQRHSSDSVIAMRMLQNSLARFEDVNNFEGVYFKKSLDQWTQICTSGYFNTNFGFKKIR